MSKQKKAKVNPTLQAASFIAFIIVALGITFRGSLVFGLTNGSSDLVAIKTALAGTAQALLGPFPTQTMPTRTASSTPTNTPLVSATPTFTPSKTFTPVPTRTQLGTVTPPSQARTAQALTVSSTPTRIATRTPIPSRTPTRVATRVVTRTPTKTRVPTLPPTLTPMPSPTVETPVPYP